MADKVVADGAARPAKRTQRKTQLTLAARRALDEAQARRDKLKPGRMPAEVDGPRGLEPTRFGDWERKGIASDF